jgi:lipid-binding SYLF domain-containing protein
MKTRMLAASFLVAILSQTGTLWARNKATERVDRAARVLAEVMGIKDKSIPQELLGKAHCVGVIPGMKRAGFGIGGKYGIGVMSCRGKDGKGWTGPSTVRVEGGSLGLQIGGTSSDIVLLLMNERGKKKLIQSKFTLGADASVAAGPVGRTAQAQTDAQMRAEILAYSRSRGLFAGVSVEGATLRPDHDANTKIYGRDISPKQILMAEIPAPESSKRLINTLNKYSSSEHK